MGVWKRVGLDFTRTRRGLESGCEVTGGREKEVAAACFLQKCLRKIN